VRNVEQRRVDRSFKFILLKVKCASHPVPLSDGNAADAKDSEDDDKSY
jgi:hypothetical protein